MILVLVPLLGVVVGLVLYAALRATGAFGVFAGSEASSTVSRSRASDASSSLGERIRGVSPGCLIAVIAAAAVWILGWFIVLAVGLNLLT